MRFYFGDMLWGKIASLMGELLPLCENCPIRRECSDNIYAYERHDKETTPIAETRLASIAVVGYLGNDLGYFKVAGTLWDNNRVKQVFENCYSGMLQKIAVCKALEILGEETSELLGVSGEPPGRN